MALTRVEFDAELTRLRERLLEMSSGVDRMLGNAVQALVEQDIELAGATIRDDDVLDRMDIEIEADCMRLIALQQPVARDLRMVGTAMKVITDLERIGDYSVDIAKIGRRLARKTAYRPLVDVARLAELVRAMLHDAMLAFVRHDLDLVARVIEGDDAVDDLFHEQRDYLMAEMQKDPSIVFPGVNLMFAAKYLERAADHVVNVAERVYFVETGELAQLAGSHKPV